MAIEVRIPTILRTYTGGEKAVDASGDTLAGLIDDLEANHPGIKAVCTAMIQAEKYGTPLGTALRVMAKENRELRLSAAEKKAAALPAQLTVPMIIFFLPVLFLVILGPVILRIHDLQKKDHSAPVVNSHPTERK